MRHPITLVCSAIAVIFILGAKPLSGQSSWHKGISIEAGAGYNTAAWKSVDHFFDTTITFKRNAFSLQPAFRLSYTIPVGKEDSARLKLTPFVGYYVFGGKSSPDTSGYEDVFLCNSIEAGIIPEYRVWRGLHVGVGFKGQYIFSTKMKHYGYFGQADSIPREWGTQDISDLYYSYAFNTGVQVKYRLKHLTFAAEGWFGITNLFSFKSPTIDVRVTENNYRILIGYAF